MIEVRRYRPGEENEVWSVYFGSTHHVVSRDYTPEQISRWAPDSIDSDAWRRRLEKTKPFVAVIDNQIVGFAELEADGHIGYFYCHHEFQRQGIGSAIMKELVGEAKRLELETLFAEVSTTAIEFFIAKGFRVEQERINLVCGAPAKQYLVRMPV